MQLNLLKTLSNLNSIALFRNQYGLSQANLAIYLSVSVSLLKMAEAGKRELPSTAALKLAYLQQFAFGKTESVLVSPAFSSDVKPAKLLNRYTGKLEVQILKAKRLLQDMQERYLQAMNRIALIQYIMAHLSNDEEGQKDQLWLEVLQADTAADVKKYGTAAQILLQWKIDTYTYSLNRAKELLPSLEVNAQL